MTTFTVCYLVITAMFSTIATIEDGKYVDARTGEVIEMQAPLPSGVPPLVTIQELPGCGERKPE